MNLEEQLKPLFNMKPYKGKSVQEIEIISGLGNGTIAKAFKANSIRTGLIEKLCEPTGKSMSLIFKRIK